MEVTINDILYAMLTVVLPLALALLKQFVATKIADSRYADAVNCVFSAVDYVNQVFVDSLKASGSFDEQAQTDAFMRAKDTALEMMKSGTVKWLESSFASVDAWLEVQIEAAVKEVKR